MKVTEIVATFGGVGYMRPASGTWGSLAALPVALVLHWIGGPYVLMLGILVTFVAGVWATLIETAGSDNHDPSEIVIDEVAGQWVALLPVSIGAAHADVGVLALWPGWVVAFLAFRAFDILKPGPIGWADRRDDPLGVMLDDILAGVAAAVVVAISAAIVHGVFMS